MATEQSHGSSPNPVPHIDPVGVHGGSHGEFRPSGPTHGLGYEPDVFSVKPILAVPAAVFITGIVAFGVTWILFQNIFDPKIQEPAENEEAAKRNAAPLNERFARISSSDAKAEFQQPRLEGLQQTEIYDADGREVTAQMVPTKPLKEGNSPHYHAEDLRPEKWPALKGIDDAITQIVTNGQLKARDGADTMELHSRWDRPKESNGGSGRRPEPAKPAEKKEPEKKEPEKKGEDPKKEPEKKGEDPKKE